MREGPLVVGLGNPLHGDAGVGVRILELLAIHERLPEKVELLVATPEFARQRDYLLGRTRVILLDAIRSPDRGAVRVLEDAALRRLDPEEEHGDTPVSARYALDLLEQAESELLRAEFTVVGVAVGTGPLALRPGLSEAVEAGAHAAAEAVLGLLETRANGGAPGG
ncbi:MAG: hydrogenase maturation protease [Planctomycetes bacterium]|nr:hydrogenase maturation protease [Planctomycetota bacterium]